MSTKKVVFLNPKTCGIYKSGGTRFKTDPETGKRTDVIDNELMEFVMTHLSGKKSPGEAHVPAAKMHKRCVIVPTYYDDRYMDPIRKLLLAEGLRGVSLGKLVDSGILSVRGGHGSPGNDQRSGSIPYIKVSDIRALRVNVNPTNLVSNSIARSFWGGEDSGLKAWDLVTPNRASSNIGEFAVLLPGEERVVFTKEVFIFRVEDKTVWDPFYLLWALTLRATRDQWRRIALMQTNREDCGNRYREIILPAPKSAKWALEVSKPFRDCFETIGNAKEKFVRQLASDKFAYVASASSFAEEDPAPDSTDVKGDVS